MSWKCMNSRIKTNFIGAVFLLGLTMNAFGQEKDRTEELDRYWKTVSKAVQQGDFEGYQATFHEDAVFVTGFQKVTYPIGTAFARWKKGFDDTKDGNMKASVDFRFQTRMGNKTTAHESGIFRYQSKNDNGEEVDVYVHFEGLLIKKSDGWKMMMEYQKSNATVEEWNALSPKSDD